MRLSNHKAQHLSEYALIFSLVLAALIAMQTYVKRGLQGRYKDASDTIVLSLKAQTGKDALLLQYEPYYTESEMTTETDMSKVETANLGGSKKTEIDYTATRQGEQKILPAADTPLAIEE